MEDRSAQDPESPSRFGSFTVTFPDVEEETVPQDVEYCLVRAGNETRRIRFHDYQEIYSVPGLYEHIFYEKLACQSPEILAKLLEHEAKRADINPAEMTVLDVGAGNGMMGEQLSDLGADTVVGVDILEEAAAAAERDRPGVYDAYYPVDLLQMPEPVQEDLEQTPFNCLTMVAALGFGDIPPEAFATAYNLVKDGGLVAFNLRDQFLDEADSSGFAHLIQDMLDQDRLEECIRVRYVHRLSITGEPLYYTGIVGRKLSDVRMTGNGGAARS